ncbi:KASH5 protein, partial [Atrichornis clamosus]|nr:KASH5 protein [Atrichornis clamosus]
NSSRQALEQARAAAEELEDVKAVAKRLEEENAELRRQARHMVRGVTVSHTVSQCPCGSRPCPPQEKEQRSLCSRAESLQEEVSLVPGGCPSRAVPQGTPAPFHPEQNQRLLAEGQGLREQVQAQAARMANMEVSGGKMATVGGAGGCV